MKLSIRIALNILIFALIMPMLVEAGHPERRPNLHCSHNRNKPVCENKSALVTVFGPRTFVRNSAKPKLETATFQIPHPKGGAAILDILTNQKHSNGLLANSEIFLNGRKLLDLQDAKIFKDNKIVIPVLLRSGQNTLGVVLRSKPGEQLTIGIQAPVDHIELKPINEPLVIGIDSLSAEATVTALGVAAGGVSIDFSVEGLGTIEGYSVITNLQGKATANFLDFPILGEGFLKVRVSQVKPLLATSTPISVVGAPRIGIQQTLTQLDVKAGQQTSFATTVDFTPGVGDTRTYQILTQQSITPDDGGITLTPLGNWTSADPISKTMPVTLTGLKTGTYVVTTTASVIKLGGAPEDKPLDSLSTALTVGVFNPNVDQALFLGAPTGNPSAISLGANQQVVFSTRVTGTEHPPEVLTLWEVNTQGQRTAIGNLLDNKENGDLVKGDGFYSGTFPVNANIEGEKRYLVTASYQGMTVKSPLNVLIITSLPIGPTSLDETNAVSDPDTGQQFAAGEILVKFKSDIPKPEINNVLAQQHSTIIGSLPEIGVLEVTVPGSDAIDVRRAVATFRNLPQVEFAEPNALLATGGGVPPDRPCQSLSDFDCDWAAIRVRAPEVWNQSEPTSKGAGGRVSVIDSLVNNHGPEVAELIDAGLDDGGITGIAPNSTVSKYFNPTTLYASEVSNSIKDAGTTQNQVINLSIWEGCGDEPDCSFLSPGTKIIPPTMAAIKREIASTNNTNLLFVTIAGNHNGTEIPKLASYIRDIGGLVVGATDFLNRRGNRGNTPAAWISVPGSGYGAWVDIAAPGENVCVGVNNSTGNCITGTGTSYAAPLVSGAAAILFAQHPLMSVDKVKIRLKTTSRPLGNEFCSTTEIGPCAGLLDVLSAVSTTSIHLTAGFKIRVVASGLPVGNENALQDIAPSQDGKNLYFIRNQNEIWRVDALGGTPEIFSTITASSVGANIPVPRLTVLSFGFNGDLFAVDGNTNPGRAYHIFLDKTKPPTLFSQGVSTASEGIAYSPGGVFGNKLFLSEFDSSPSRITSMDSNGNVDTPAVIQLSDSNRLTGLAFGSGGNFGSELFGVDHNGTFFKVTPDGLYTEFAVDPSIGRNETLAFGSENSPFGEFLFVTPDGKGQIIKIDPNGVSSVFASGFAGFDFRGVTGLKFSQDKKTLFVTDDNAGIIYAISKQ